MRLIFEFKPKRGIWVIIPTIIFFGHGSLGQYRDITLVFLCFGYTLRFNEKK